MGNLIKQIQMINRGQIVCFLEMCCSRESLLRYQLDVPYVEFPREIFCQWDSLYMRRMDWFKNNYSRIEAKALSVFNKVIRRASKAISRQIVDMENAIDLPDWLPVMTAAHTALQVFKTETGAHLTREGKTGQP